MLCTVAIRRVRAHDGGMSYSLRITGKTALGPSGTGGRDTKDFSSAEELRAILQNLGMDDDALVTATTILNDPDDSDRFRTIVEDVQIPFGTLEAADLYLFD